MDRLLLLLAIASAAAVAAHFLQRRRPDAPVRTGWSVPAQIDRNDFDNPKAPWLVVIFTSASCDACAAVAATAAPLASDTVEVQVVEYDERRDLHDRYGIDAVPLVVIADALGVVRVDHVGPVSATHLWGSLAEVREPGSTPDGCGAGG
ncbi:MAG: hypothetical protein VYC56_08345 [Actinomycetota bacterium]|nr:hypothetical protein [Actinomycetota bacterium]MEC9395891.1 hypothetical protein [Actinomycetota bacterium]MED6327604.1 hypothetical protein [Actinomycetota bacterium]MEE2958357.1 hypothetical protein [Actinomycetota bacterium]